MRPVLVVLLAGWRLRRSPAQTTRSIDVRPGDPGPQRARGIGRPRRDRWYCLGSGPDRGRARTTAGRGAAVAGSSRVAQGSPPCVHGDDGQEW